MDKEINEMLSSLEEKRVLSTDIISIIDQYVQLSANQELLEKKEKKPHIFLEPIDTTEVKKELAQVSQLLDAIHKIYIEVVNSMDANQLKEVAEKVSIKFEENERKIAELYDERDWADEKEYAAFVSGNEKEVRYYGTIKSSFYNEIKRIESLQPYYRSFISTLNYRAESVTPNLNLSKKEKALMSTIDQYVKISTHIDNLKYAIEIDNKHEFNAKIEGDIAFSEGNYELEQAYNKSVGFFRAEREKEEKQLTQTTAILENVHQTYLTAIDSMDTNQIKKIAKKVSMKSEDIQRSIDSLTEKRKWATQQGDICFSNNNYQEEKYYNDITSECYFEIEKLAHYQQYYNSFVKDLNRRATMKQTEDFDLTSPTAPAGPRM